MKEWLGEPGDNKLADWDISRDATYFVLPNPGKNTQKFFYVWLDAPVGSFGSFRNYVEKRGRSQKEIEEFLRPGSNTEMMHFIGKDILYFHALFWPAMLQFAGYRMPTKVFAHGFLTVDGQKMSKSRGTFITAESYLQQGLNPEWLRYYYAAKLNSTMEDIDLSLDDFVARVNSDLIGKYVNIASRAAKFITERFSGKLTTGRPANLGSKKVDSSGAIAETNQPFSLFYGDSNLLGPNGTFAGYTDSIRLAYERREFGVAVRATMDLADKVNKYFADCEPWELAKKDNDVAPESLHEVCSLSLIAFFRLTVLLGPILPDLTSKSAKNLVKLNL